MAIASFEFGTKRILSMPDTSSRSLSSWSPILPPSSLAATTRHLSRSSFCATPFHSPLFLSTVELLATPSSFHEPFLISSEPAQLLNSRSIHRCCPPTLRRTSAFLATSPGASPPTFCSVGSADPPRPLTMRSSRFASASRTMLCRSSKSELCGHDSACRSSKPVKSCFLHCPHLQPE